MPDIQISKLIQVKRAKLGLTQQALAEFLGLGLHGERTVRGWELGEHRPSPSKLKKIISIEEDFPFKYARKTKPRFTFIDLFSGIGGIRIPFQELGGKCVFSSEWDKHAKKTYLANFGDMPSGDITNIAASEIPKHDVLLAGFPCQAFSQAGLRKGFSDTRGTMFFEIQRILAHHRPKAFLLENVKQLKGHDGGRTLQVILQILRGQNKIEVPDNVLLSDGTRHSLSQKLNYNVAFKVLASNEFGVPQKRERIYLVGFDKDYFGTVDIDKIFQRLKRNLNSCRLGDILEKNLDVDTKYTISSRLLEGHERRRREHKRKGNGFGFSLFNAESPYCNTISARYYKDGSEVLIDQSDIGKNPRKLTPRECARIQGFPASFKVNAVSDTQIYRQFGNSVSVPVVKAIADEMMKIVCAEN